MALNHISISGRLTKDPELRYTPKGKAVASFTLAVDRDYASRYEGERETDFINCVAWGGTAEFVSKYFEKGKMAIVAGRLQIRNYTDKDGNKRTAAEVVAANVYFGGSKQTEQHSSTPKRDINELNKFSGTRWENVEDDEDDEDLPF